MFLLRRFRPRFVPLNRAPAPMTRREMAEFGRRFARSGRGFWFSLAIDAIWPLLKTFTRFRVRGAEHLPSTGGVLVATNHLSFADPTTVTAFCLHRGRVPRYLAKSGLWDVPVIRSVMRTGKHIPVYRDASTPGGAYRDAVAAVAAGECVVIFPEGTFSADPDGWPMRGKSGIARIALVTGAPVIPLANWGTHHVLPARARFPRLLPRRTVDLIAGPPVDLADLACAQPSREVLEEATARIMAEITTLVALARGRGPAERSPGA